MSQSTDDTLVVTSRGYSSVTAALGAFDAVRAVYDGCDAGSPASCDAAVITPHETDLSSRVLRETPPSRQRRASGAHVEGLAKRLARYLGAGLALTGGAPGRPPRTSPQPSPLTRPTRSTPRPDQAGAGEARREPSDRSLRGADDRVAFATNAADARASKEVRASVEQLEAQIAGPDGSRSLTRSAERRRPEVSRAWRHTDAFPGLSRPRNPGLDRAALSAAVRLARSTRRPEPASAHRLL